MSEFDKSKVGLPGAKLYSEDAYLETFSCGDVKELFMIIRNSDDQRLVSLINRRCNLEANELYVPDFKYILHWQRINSYIDNPMRLKWRCRHCSNLNNSTVTAANLVETSIDPAYEADDMMIELPSLKTPVSIRLQKVRDEYDVKQYYREVEKVIPDGGQIKEGIVACMLDIEGMSLADKIKMIRETFKPDDMYVIEQFETEFHYGIEDYVSVKCSNKECGEQSEVAFTFDLSSFFPSVSDSRFVRNRVFSRKALKSAADKLRSDELCGSSMDEKPTLDRTTGAKESSGESSEISRTDELTSISDITGSR